MNATEHTDPKALLAALTRAPSTYPTHLRKGDAVAFTDSKGKPAVGLLRSAVVAGKAAKVEDGTYVYTVDPRKLRIATDAERAACPLCKPVSVVAGDAVEFDNKGKVVQGVLVSVRAGRAKVAVGHTEYGLPVAMLRKREVAPGDAGDAKGYAVTQYKESRMQSQETTCFNAVVTFDGEPVVELHNDGIGGCTGVNTYLRSHNLSDSALVARRHAAAKKFTDTLSAMGKAAGLGQYMEVEDLFVLWYRVDRNTGVSFADFLAAEAKAFNALVASPITPKPLPE